MTRPTKYHPHNDPWAALVARGAIPYQTAAKYRNGARCPNPQRIEILRRAGYMVEVIDWEAKCDEWPERAGD
jgi:hypothetical protein